MPNVTWVLKVLLRIYLILNTNGWENVISSWKIIKNGVLEKLKI